MIKTAKRLEFLDGIRGFMAVMVVMNHFLLVYFPDFSEPEFTGLISVWINSWQQRPLAMLSNGTAAVQYFFVLTGFLVARSMLPGKDCKPEQLVRKSMNRYLRLLPMVAGATVFTYLTMVFGLQFHREILNKLPVPETVAGYCDFAPTISLLIRSVFYQPFVDTSLFVAPFWTIRYEFWGYILCMLACYALRGSRLRRHGYAVVLVLVCALIEGHYIGFFLGVLTADLCFCTARNETYLSRFYCSVLYHPVTAGALVMLGIVLTYFPVYQFLPQIAGRSLGIAMFLFGAMKFPRLTRLFEGRVLQWLGRISFGIYAFHWPLMLSLEPMLFDWLCGFLSYEAAAWMALALTVPVILAAGWGGYWLFEKKCRWDIGLLLNRFAI